MVVVHHCHHHYIARSTVTYCFDFVPQVHGPPWKVRLLWRCRLKSRCVSLALHSPEVIFFNIYQQLVILLVITIFESTLLLSPVRVLCCFLWNPLIQPSEPLKLTACKWALICKVLSLVLVTIYRSVACTCFIEPCSNSSFLFLQWWVFYLFPLIGGSPPLDVTSYTPASLFLQWCLIWLLKVPTVMTDSHMLQYVCRLSLKYLSPIINYVFFFLIHISLFAKKLCSVHNIIWYIRTDIKFMT